MKHFSIFIMAATINLIISACNDNSPAEAVEQAKQVQEAIKENRPGTISTSGDGWTMKAKINGKNWEASSIMPPDAAGRIIGYYNEEYIGLPYNRQYFVVGKKIMFSENNAVDLATDDEVGLWGGRKGEMEITKVDDKWAEGKFFFYRQHRPVTKNSRSDRWFFPYIPGKNTQ